MSCWGITQFHRMLPLHNGTLIGFGVSGTELVCGKSAQLAFVSRCSAMKLLSFLFVDIIALLCGASSLRKKSIKKVKYFIQKNNRRPWSEGYFDICVMLQLFLPVTHSVQ